MATCKTEFNGLCGVLCPQSRQVYNKYSTRGCENPKSYRLWLWILHIILTKALSVYDTLATTMFNAQKINCIM